MFIVKTVKIQLDLLCSPAVHQRLPWRSPTHHGIHCKLYISTIYHKRYIHYYIPMTKSKEPRQGKEGEPPPIACWLNPWIVLLYSLTYMSTYFITSDDSFWNTHTRWWLSKRMAAEEWLWLSKYETFSCQLLILLRVPFPFSSGKEEKIKQKVFLYTPLIL